MRIEGQRRSSNFEDRGTGRGGRGGGIPIQALVSLVSFLGFKGTLIAGAVLAIGFFALPAGLKALDLRTAVVKEENRWLAACRSGEQRTDDIASPI